MKLFVCGVDVLDRAIFAFVGFGRAGAIYDGPKMSVLTHPSGRGVRPLVAWGHKMRSEAGGVSLRIFCMCVWAPCGLACAWGPRRAFNAYMPGVGWLPPPPGRGWVGVGVC